MTLQRQKKQLRASAIHFRPETTNMFVIVRHGNTFTASETPRRIGARTDIPLTESGQAQARALGEYFAECGWQFRRVLISPLQRTRQTAEAILAAQGSTVIPQIAEFLREIDHGPDENRTEEDVLARIGQEALSAWDKDAITPPGWVVDRTMRIDAWRELFASTDATEPPVLLVTSNGAARFSLMADAALQRAAGQLASLKMPTGSYGLIQPGDQGRLVIGAWGVRP